MKRVISTGSKPSLIRSSRSASRITSQSRSERTSNSLGGDSGERLHHGAHGEAEKPGPLGGSRKSGVCLAQIGFGGVTAHHAVAVEVVGDLGNGLLHHPDPRGSIVMVERQNGGFELFVQRIPFASRVSGTAVRTDPPAGHVIHTSFEPPTVQDAEIEKAIEGCLHSAGPRSFHRR